MQRPPFIDTVGFNFQNSHVNLNLAIDALAQEGLITILAEPNLVCVSGETASFLAGGEFPYPVPTAIIPTPGSATSNSRLRSDMGKSDLEISTTKYWGVRL